MEDQGIQDYGDFHRWSVTSRAEFWKSAIERLNIIFATPPAAIFESNENSQTRWCVGGRLNIVTSCFANDDSCIAIVSKRPGSPIRSLTYGQLQALANRVSNSLQSAGYGKGDAIAVVLPMTELAVAIYLGIVQAGCAVVSIADSFASQEIATRLQISAASAVLTYDQQTRAGKMHPLYERVTAATDHVEQDIKSIVIPENGKDLATSLRGDDIAWDHFLTKDDDFSPVICDVDETMNILFSSGTTGDPKAIPWNHLTPIRCAIDGHCHHDIRPGDVCMWPTNLGWMMGPWLIFATLINRGTIALYEDAAVGVEFADFVEQAGVTMLGVVPTLVKTWKATGDIESADWTSIRAFSSTGESSQPDDMKYLSGLAGDKPIIEYCGGTEIGGGYAASVLVLPNVASAFNSLALGHDVVLIDEAGQPADEGEVFLVPPSMGLSTRLLNRDHEETYFSNTPNLSGFPTLRRHGDQFRRVSTPAGTYYVAGGRVDDTMNLGGIKVSSAEIERVLNRIDGIEETAAVGHADTSEQGGPTRLVVFAVCSQAMDVESLRREMNAQLKSQLNPLFRVDSVRFVETMPRTASNKLMRRELRALL